MKKNILKYLRHPSLILYRLCLKKWIKLNDKTFIKMQYLYKFDKKLDLKKPETFNEKLQWLKLFDRNDEYIKMVDKITVKDYIEEMIGKEHIIPNLGVYDHFDDIDFSKLPHQFVIKCNHYGGSEGVVICRDKNDFNIEKAREKINSILTKNLYEYAREWPYKSIQPKILIEEYLSDDNELRDYKFFCFHGKVRFFKVDFDRFKNHRANYYDTNGNILPFGEIICPPDFNRKIELPSNLNDMIILAEKISQNIPFVRIDFYDVKNKIYFGEITLYPAAGIGKIEPEEWDKKIGDYLELPELPNKK